MHGFCYLTQMHKGSLIRHATYPKGVGEYQRHVSVSLQCKIRPNGADDSVSDHCHRRCSLFALKDMTRGASALAGGVAAWLPNVLFLFIAWRLQGQTPASGRVAWSFALGEIAKVFATIILLIVALGVFDAVFGRSE